MEIKKRCGSILPLFVCVLFLLNGCGGEKCDFCDSTEVVYHMFDYKLCKECHDRILGDNSVDKKKLKSDAEEEAKELLGQLLEQVKSGTYKSLGNGIGKKLEDLSKEFPSNAVIATCNNMESAIFWNDCLKNTQTGDDSYSMYLQEFEEALVHVEPQLLPEYTEFINHFIESEMGSQRYKQLKSDVNNKENTIAQLTKEDQIAILVYVFTEQDKQGDNITDAQTEQIWKKACEKFNITYNYLTDLLMNTDLGKEANIRIEGENTETSGTNKNVTTSTNTGRESDAWVCAMHIVEQDLKAPATAKFCKYPDAIVACTGSNDYAIKGYVDSENSFGANIRTHFTVTLTLTEQGYKNGFATYEE